MSRRCPHCGGAMCVKSVPRGSYLLTGWVCEPCQTVTERFGIVDVELAVS